jgi:hypothetical protein
VLAENLEVVQRTSALILAAIELPVVENETTDAVIAEVA